MSGLRLSEEEARGARADCSICTCSFPVRTIKVKGGAQYCPACFVVKYGTSVDAKVKKDVERLKASPVVHPAYYRGDGTYEAWNVCDAWCEGWKHNVEPQVIGHLYHMLPYLCRLGQKEGSGVLEDLKKVQQWLERSIEHLEEGS